ncbi:MAG: VOC family protein [Desulfobacterales bacterium]
MEISRLTGPQEKLLHVEVRIGDSVVMLADEFPEDGSLGPKSLKGSPVTIHLYVENADAFVERAVAAGAKITMPLADMFWGDRYGQLEDPFGHRWSVATHVRDLSSEELSRPLKRSLPKIVRMLKGENKVLFAPVFDSVPQSSRQTEEPSRQEPVHLRQRRAFRDAHAAQPDR